MTLPVIEYRGLEELMKRMNAVPEVVRKAAVATMDAALLVLWEKVPPYPGQPEGTTYTRTGTLGRSLGSSQTGGRTGGRPTIYENRPLGVGGGRQGRFGTNLAYAPHVIGEGTQAGHMGHWWTMGTVAARAKEKILRVFDILAVKVAAFLDRGGGSPI